RCGAGHATKSGRRSSPASVPPAPGGITRAGSLRPPASAAGPHRRKPVIVGKRAQRVTDLLHQPSSTPPGCAASERSFAPGTENLAGYHGRVTRNDGRRRPDDPPVGWLPHDGGNPPCPR